LFIAYMDRRDFIKVSGAAAAGLALSGYAPRSWSKREEDLFGPKKTGHFSLTQLSSVTDTIGNSYLLKTAGGKVIMMDGGYASELPKLRKYLAEAGNHVDLWFISHPHEDHMEALATILQDPQGVTIDKVIYSRVQDEVLDHEPVSAENARRYYRALDNTPARTDFLNLHQPFQRFDIDGIGILVIGVDHPGFESKSYNNQSTIIRVWDDTKSVVFLGDAEEECGNAALKECREYLDCDYLQMAHHGQNGVSEEFYKTVNFRACLWPTSSWVWEPGEERTWLKTYDTRRWMEEKGITEHHVSCLEEDWTLL
jgi:L-ascorbate metabolism protein UlaG (beta-lactamase superfamily)